MRRLLGLVLFVICTLLLFTETSYAHPGKTDSNGGHWDHSTGTYHYHHGYPAHQHTGGKCPYKFDDNTSHESSTSKSDTSKNEVSVVQPKETRVKEKHSFFEYAVMWFLEIVLHWLAYVMFLDGKGSRIKRHAKVIFGFIVWYAIYVPLLLFLFKSQSVLAVWIRETGVSWLALIIMLSIFVLPFISFIAGKGDEYAAIGFFPLLLSVVIAVTAFPVICSLTLIGAL